MLAHHAGVAGAAAAGERVGPGLPSLLQPTAANITTVYLRRSGKTQL